MQKARIAKIKLARSNLLIFFILGGVVAAIVIMSMVAKKHCAEVYRRDVIVSVGSSSIHTEKVSTPESRQKGLSGRACIDEDTAMLFEFEQAEPHGIWMKDMRFSIDILWLDESKKVIYIEQSVSPDTYPTVFRSPKAALYVLETSPGLVDQLSVSIGQQLNW